jgi:2-oxoisovalerate dehydrogenase E2 component (dihydrolipoyl transacylase)
MATSVTMPRLGESVTEGTITRWLKAEGEEIEKDEPLCEVDTDKVNTELPSPVAGRIEKFLISEGTTVDVGTEIVSIAGVQGSSSPDEASFRKEWPVAGTEAQPMADDGPKRRAVEEARADGDGRGRGESAEMLRLKRSSPVVRKLATEHDVDIAKIPGTGIGGRVTKKDIESYIKERTAGFEAAPSRLEPMRERLPVYGGDQVVELTSVRRSTAERMAMSKREVPHTWTMVEADVTGLVTLRDLVKEEFARQEGVKLTYLPFIVQAVIESLKEHRVLNSVWDGDRIVLRKRINIGVAVDLEDALIVPVIHDADGLNFLGLVRAINDQVRRARTGKLRPDDIVGGTFTISNPGSLGSVASTPIINHPQAAILSSEAIVKRPVVVGDDAIAIRSMMNIDVSFDHRIVDGGAVLRFLGAVKQHLEDIGPGRSLAYEVVGQRR